MSIENMRNKITAPIEDMIGVSTISFGGIETENAIDAIADAGFKTIEILMSVDRMGAIGYPEPLPATCWLYPENVNDPKKNILRKKLEQFAYTTAHVQLLDANIASLNPGIRKESARQYIKCIELTRELGIPLITFHSGCIHRAGYPGIAIEESMKYNREFLEEAAEYADKYNLYMGYECLGPEGPQLVDMIKSADKDRFGVHIDLMWSTSAINREGTFKLVVAAAERIVEIHVHGGLRRSDGFTSHLPLTINNVVDFQNIVPQIKETGFKGPFIFEIASSEDAQTVIEHCKESKKILFDYLQGSIL